MRKGVKTMNNFVVQAMYAEEMAKSMLEQTLHFAKLQGFDVQTVGDEIVLTEKSENGDE
ncbi:hypothetical protein SJ619_13340 [Enterococcus faecium]|jgi:hypothetical protein|nr:MAG: hypothetical protein [Bacteriophage sp.]UVX86704.1 MAG: hypothetical protein [Bacteriophage sp.]